jgi:anthranilate phosphoribosyltransferase
MVLGKETPDRNLDAVRDIVVLNAAGGVVAYELAKDASQAKLSINERFAAAISKVRDALDSGAATEKLSAWIAATQA